MCAIWMGLIMLHGSTPVEKGQVPLFHFTGGTQGVKFMRTEQRMLDAKGWELVFSSCGFGLRR